MMFLLYTFTGKSSRDLTILFQNRFFVLNQAIFLVLKLSTGKNNKVSKLMPSVKKGTFMIRFNRERKRISQGKNKRIVKREYENKRFTKN